MPDGIEMPKSVKALVTPTMLQWARELAGCTLEQAGKSAGATPAAIAAWESPDSNQRPTFRQAQRLARAYRVPLALFYLERPTPDLEYPAVPEFRRIDAASGELRPHSRRLRWMIRQAQERQAFAIKLLQDDGSPPIQWVASASLAENPEAVGGRIRVALGVGDDEPGIANKDRALDWWVERVENSGAFVSRYRPDGNQYWFVEPTEARGLSLCHPLAPYIVLNSRDAPAGRTFTLMHELAHLHYGQCGLDDLSDEALLPVDNRALEQRCNQVAAAILMPSARFRQEWGNAAGDLNDKVGRVADAFGVSRLAVAVRAKSDVLRFISEGQLNDIRMWLDAEYSEFRASMSGGGGGGIPPATRVLKDFGGRYTRLVFDAYAEGILSRLEAADALEARLGDIDDIRGRL